jgi:hypothetical protein
MHCNSVSLSVSVHNHAKYATCQLQRPSLLGLLKFHIKVVLDQCVLCSVQVWYCVYDADGTCHICIHRADEFVVAEHSTETGHKTLLTRSLLARTTRYMGHILKEAIALQHFQ